MKSAALPVFLAVVACAEITEPDLGGMPVHDVSFTAPVELSFRATVENDTFYVFAEPYNPNADTATMRHGACSFAIRIVGSTGALWDNRLPPSAACIDLGYEVAIPPGESVSQRVFRLPVTTLLALVPEATYDVKVYIRVEKALREYSAGDVRAGKLYVAFNPGSLQHCLTRA